MLEVVLKLFFDAQIIALVNVAFNFGLDFFSRLIGFTKLQLGVIASKLVLSGAFYTFNASVNERREIIVIQVKSLLIQGLVPLLVKTVVLFQMKDLFDKQKHLD